MASDSPPSPATPQRTALVTGGNRGIGLEICRGLGRSGLRVLIANRDPAAGRKAADRLQGEGITAASHPAELEDPGSVEALTAWAEREFGGVDVLVNNAGIYLDAEVAGLQVDPETVRKSMQINAFAPLRLTQLLAPGMRGRGYGRIVNLSSGYGAGRAFESGGVLAYKLSKLALGGMTRLFAAELRGSGVLVNAMDPGWVRTEMGGPRAPRTAEQAADTAVWLATLPAEGPTGGFFRDRKPISW